MVNEKYRLFEEKQHLMSVYIVKAINKVFLKLFFILYISLQKCHFYFLEHWSPHLKKCAIQVTSAFLKHWYFYGYFCCIMSLFERLPSLF
jgi:hypothetical protein